MNSVLFGGFGLETAFQCAAFCGYRGIELSAIEGMSSHLVVERWRELAPMIRDLAAAHALKLLAIEQPSLEPDLMREAFGAAADLAIPIVNCGPGGQSGDEESLTRTIARLRSLADMAQDFGVTLCVKAHVGCAIDNTATTLRALSEIESESLGLDFDPSHLLRAGEQPVQALRAVVHRVRHVHLRDCRMGVQGPGKPEEQIPGRGDVDIRGLLDVLREARYEGPIDLEIIGARAYSVWQCAAIAAESRGYLAAAANLDPWH